MRPGCSGADGREAVVEDHYYLCSIEADAKRLAELVREHWGIENRCHWTLDVTFGEDLCGTRDATSSRNLSTMREMAIATLRPTLPRRPCLSSGSRRPSIRISGSGCWQTFMRKPCASIIRRISALADRTIPV